MTKREQAIAIIEYCRDTHARWVRWQRRAGKNWNRKVKRGAIGGPSFHRKWVRNYDFVLKVLRR